ncbi:ABC transporter ATP-binding protein [Actinomadura barringtoniae]|nr:ABC transporter ATP-binding protein [Actinomadura barringtoniae]
MAEVSRGEPALSRREAESGRREAGLSQGEPVLEARSLYRFFRAGDEETLALQGVSLSLSAGEFVAVSGPSGSGKSTLLACLAGLDDPDGGTVRILGERLSHRPEPERARLRSRRIGVLMQTGNLLAHLTLAQHIVLCRRLAGRPQRRRSSVKELLASVGLADHEHAYPGRLSGGEAARAGLAVALANDPAVLLADEPTGELDTATELQILALLEERRSRGRAVLVASHSPAVTAAAGRVLKLRDGKAI